MDVERRLSEVLSELARTLVTDFPIESAKLHGEVATLDCDACQGYYFSHPMSAEAVEGLLAGGDPLATLPVAEALSS